MDDLRTLLTQSPAILHTLEQAWEALKQAKAKAGPPPQRAVLSVDELLEHQRRADLCAVLERQARGRYDEALQAKRRHVTALQQAGMPPEQWVTVGGIAVGISVTNWSGPTHDLHVAPGEGPFPPLNLRHTGD